MKSQNEHRDHILKLNQILNQFMKIQDHSKPIKHTHDIIKLIITSINDIYEYGYNLSSSSITASAIQAKYDYSQNYKHYWNKICDKLNHMESVRFILTSNSRGSAEDNAKLWILIELSNKSLHKALEAVYEIKELRLCWSEDSILRRYFKDVYDILQQLTLCDYTIDSDFLCAFYEKYPTKAPLYYIQKIKTTTNNTKYNDEYNTNMTSYNSSNSSYNINSTSNSSNMQTSGKNPNDLSKFKSNLERFNNILNRNNSPKNSNFNESSSTTSSGLPTDKKNLQGKTQESSFATTAAMTATNTTTTTNTSDNNYNNNTSMNSAFSKQAYQPNDNANMYKSCPKKYPEEQQYHEDNMYSSAKQPKYEDKYGVKETNLKSNYHKAETESYQNNYYNGNQPKKDPSDDPKKVNKPTNSENFTRAVKETDNTYNPTAYDDEEEKLAKSAKFLNHLKTTSNLDNASYGFNGYNEDNYYNPNSSKNNKPKNNGYSNNNTSPNANSSGGSGGNNYMNDYNTNLTTNDTTPVKNYMDMSPYGMNNASESPKKTKNSEELYLERYKTQELYEYREKPIKQIKFEDQENKCHSCLGDLNTWVLFLKPKFGYCHYTGYWYCNKCISKDKCLIPWYVTEKWEFKHYTVSKEAKEELEKLYTKCIIKIDLNMDIVKRNKALYETLVMKRQLHLIFDMLCSTSFIMDFVETDGNLLLKPNLFSLKNLYDIYNGSLYKHMENWYITLSKHIMGSCQTCQSKGKICIICQDNNNKLFPFDIKNTAFCPKCKRFYHSRCLQVKKCIQCTHNE